MLPLARKVSGVRFRNEDGGGTPDPKKVDPPAGGDGGKKTDDKDTTIGNLNGALKEARDIIKKLEKANADRDAAEAKTKADAEAKALEDKGAFEQLKTKWETDKAEYEKKIADLTPNAEKWGTHLKTSLDENLAKIPKEKKELADKLLAGKSPEEQIALLPDLLKDWTAPAKSSSFGGAPGNGGAAGGKDSPSAPTSVKDQKTVAGALAAALGGGK